ncbi:hypothetical protein JCM3770_000613 [Rhodotorula araucariae]
MFFCIPIVFGMAESIKPDPARSGVRPCPRCHNNSCQPIKRRKRFELFWIPLIPFKAKHVWMCPICQYSYAADPSEKDAPVSGQQPAPAASGRGYDVGYEAHPHGNGAKV